MVVRTPTPPCRPLRRQPNCRVGRPGLWSRDVPAGDASLLEILRQRSGDDPINVVATTIFLLATLVPTLEPNMKMALVEGAVTGGGLTVIANAPNPVGQALLGSFFDHAVHPWRLFVGAALPTLIAGAAFRLL